MLQKLFWSDQSQPHKFITLFIYISVVLQRSEQYTTSQEKSTQDVCETPGCYNAAEHIQDNIDRNVQPCDDFYRFACGGFVSKNEIPENENVVSHMTIAADKVTKDIHEQLIKDVGPGEPRIFELTKNYFKACNDESTIQELGLKPLQKVLDRLGGWPVVEGDKWNQKERDWMDITVKLRELGFSQKYLFDISTYHDLKNPSRYTLYIGIQETLIQRVILQQKLKHPYLQAYLKYMLDISVMLGADMIRARRELEKVIIFEQKLLLISGMEFPMRLDIDDIADLEKQVSDIPWLTYLNRITSPVERLVPTQKVLIERTFYLYHLQRVLKRESKRTVANYLIWRAIADSVPHLHNEIKEKYANFQKIMFGQVERPQPRWKECLRLLKNTVDGIPAGLSSIFVRNHLDNETRKDVANIVQAVVDQFQLRLHKLEWMDDFSRARAARKLKVMRNIIGYADEMIRDEILDKYTQKLKTDPKSHFQNVLNVRRFNYEHTLSRLRATDSFQWTSMSDVTEINAYYAVLSNSFAILAGILQPPLFNTTWPSYAKFGSIGFIIGHEIMHAFDSRNHQFDESGSRRQWYTLESGYKYSTKFACFRHQYSTYRDERLGLNVNGFTTLDENLADNVGLKIAYEAYKKWEKENIMELGLPGLTYTPEQMFWISSVNFLCSKATDQSRMYSIQYDEHTPDYFRVIGVMSNSDEFSKAFKCLPDSPMNPKRKCKIT